MNKNQILFKEFMMFKMVLLITLSFTVFSCSSNKKSEVAKKTEEVKTEAKEMVKSVKTSSVKSEGSTDSTSEMMNKCVLNGDERIIEIKKTGEGCEVLYTKFSETNSIASDSNGMDHCQTVQDKIQSNLEHAGFNCGK